VLALACAQCLSFVLDSRVVNRRACTPFAMVSDEEFLDPYPDILNFGAPSTPDNVPIIIAENRLVDVGREAKEPIDIAAQRKADRFKWVHWNNFLEEELGDMWAALLPGEEWVGECRDQVEMQRGRAIWSSRTEEEIMKEARKAAIARSQAIPSKVALVVTTVYLDKLCTLKELRAEEAVLVKDYLKWVRDQRKRTKKDPLPGARKELAKQWVERFPSFRMSLLQAQSPNNKQRFSTGLHFRNPPTVVLDEITPVLDKVAPKDETYQIIPFNGGPSTSASKPLPTNNIKTSSTQNAPLSAASVVNWYKTAEELRDSVSNPSDEESPLAPGYAPSIPAAAPRPSYTVDDVPMFVANNCPEEYFVVM